MAGRKKQTQFHMLYRGVKLLVVVFVMALAVFGSSSFAKYYSMQQQKGVAVASDFYFSSDVLKQGVTFTEGEVIPTQISGYASNVWNSNSTLSTVTFTLRNYDNFLLYNDSNIEIVYDLYAAVAEEDTSGITYYLSTGGNQYQLSTTPYKLEGVTLGGGSPIENVYSIQYRYEQGIQEMPKNVYVWAVPTSPSYIPAEQYTLGTMISVGATAASNFTFESGWDFITLSDLESALTAEQQMRINAQIGFSYEISTTGTNVNGADPSKVDVELSWNSKYIEMDKFNKYYQTPVQNGDMKTITMSLDTYTSNDILFYRTSKFKVSEFATQGDFYNLVTATIVEAADIAALSETEEAVSDVQSE